MIKMSLVSIQMEEFVTDLRKFCPGIGKLFPIYDLQVCYFTDVVPSCQVLAMSIDVILAACPFFDLDF